MSVIFAGIFRFKQMALTITEPVAYGPLLSFINSLDNFTVVLPLLGAFFI
jgi:hypothetical protein